MRDVLRRKEGVREIITHGCQSHDLVDFLVLETRNAISQLVIMMGGKAEEVSGNIRLIREFRFPGVLT